MKDVNVKNAIEVIAVDACIVQMYVPHVTVTQGDAVNLLTCSRRNNVVGISHAAEIKNRLPWIAPPHHVQGHRAEAGVRNRRRSGAFPEAPG